MRVRMVFLAFVTSAIVFFTGLSAASARDYAYCIQGDFAGAGECIFSTRAQCQAAASGRTTTYTEIAISAPMPNSSTRAARGVVRTDIVRAEGQ